MPIATPEVYAEMLDRAKEHSFAFPAINCTSSETINAALKGFADVGSDGIIQFSTGGAEFGSGLGAKDMVTGVVKMRVDTDTQYAFTRPVAGHMFANYDGVLKIDGEVGDKKTYDPRNYMKKAEAAMTERVIEACNDLHCAGRSVSAG